MRQFYPGILRCKLPVDLCIFIVSELLTRIHLVSDIFNGIDVVIEPKGKHLEKTDEWKQKFLLKIKERFSSKGLLKFIETYRYRIIGLPFYNQEGENQFKEELLKVVP